MPKNANAALPLTRQVDELSPADRWKLLRWLARNDPQAVRLGLDRMADNRDIPVIGWRINGLDADGGGSPEDSLKAG